MPVLFVPEKTKNTCRVQQGVSVYYTCAASGCAMQTRCADHENYTGLIVRDEKAIPAGGTIRLF
ncbi:hypothetical protein HK25_07955 [Acetobacter sp. DsW_059]|nr:hypothetical protein HK25_07955 [Acetobacter sp. DsW_059]